MHETAFQLNKQYDVQRLQHDLGCVDQAAWMPERPFAPAGEQPITAANWTCVPLRSPHGDENRTDPGGPALDAFAPTRYLAHAPYLQEILDKLPAEVRSARLLSLAPGAAVEVHRDAYTGFAHGQVRLHIPITTNDQAVIEIDGEPHTWQPGTLWLGDFTRPHRLWNNGASARVHLVIDVLTSPQLLDLVPAASAAGLDRSSIIVNRPRVSLTPEQRLTAQARFTIPPQAMGTQTSNDSPVAGSIQWVRNQFVFTVNERPLYGLVPTSPTSFRFEGWTDARTVHVDQDVVRLVSRQGNKVKQLSLARNGASHEH
ncbi:aspartyl/asparaginyl beta-hydroxylase domain-containing protein [Streptomyces sp. NPDC051020]|uniref:aspartyl/asparaginyl beta-hydroxylase domain-containing protein n=1 Tax=Streptomyces sp. NPDC051020 TaxID=3155409 RepID=UPI00343A8196